MDRSNVVPLRSAGRFPLAEDDLAVLALRASEQDELLAQLVDRLESDPQLRTLSRRLARRLTWHGAEDLMQTTLERVVRGIASYRGSGDLVGWVARIMRNAQIEWARKEASEGRKLSDYSRESDAPGGTTLAPDVEEREQRERVLAVWTRRRNDPDVEVMWDRLYVGMTVEQIMRRTGHPRSTVYSMLKKGALKFLHDWKQLTAGGSRPTGRK
jgi:RNA polymerase sigma factor (sigma-70 family)